MYDYTETIKMIYDYFTILHPDEYILNMKRYGHNQGGKSLHYWSILHVER